MYPTFPSWFEGRRGSRGRFIVLSRRFAGTSGHGFIFHAGAMDAIDLDPIRL
jgi:hypothetical protein